MPEKIAGKYWMYWLGTAADKTDQMGLSSSADLLHWNEETDEPILPRRPGKFDSRVVEPGPPPIVTRDGIVLIYNGADDHLVYRTVAERAAGVRARTRMGEKRASAKRCFRRGHGQEGKRMAVLLRRSR